jgi:chromosome segregation ATPase
VRTAPARTLAAAGTAGTGLAAAAAAFLVVRGLPGLLYAAGICLAALVGAVAIIAGGSTDRPRLELESAQAPIAARPARWRRKSRIIAELELHLTTTTAELEEHRRAIANLATQLSRETEGAQAHAAQLGERIRELETERDALQELVTEERERFEQTLDRLGGGIGGHADELAELERELEALIAR